MPRHKLLNLTLLVVIVASLLLGGGGQVFAQQGPKDGKGPTYPHQLHRPVTQADREAAAANNKAAREAAAQVPNAPAVAAATPGGVPDYFGAANWAFSPMPLDPLTGLPSGAGILKFQSSLANDGGLTIAQGTPCDTIGYTGTQTPVDCYEIHLQQFAFQILPPPWPKTTIRGYGEYVNGVAQAQTYLGPVIVAHRNVPVRVKFYNDLGTGADGDLFIPVDTTYMGAGMGPKCTDGGAPPTYVDRAADGTCPNGYTPAMYTENRATVHLHGGTTPWISDGTPHQWITPAGETTAYPEGVSVENVPDMNVCQSPTDGCWTLYYTNQQSARLMFYHDHAYGITRLNVYVGEAAGYLLTDDTEQAMINGGSVGYTDPEGSSQTANFDPGTLPGLGIPIVIQDKSFVDATTVLRTDPTWRWGTGAVSGTTADGLPIHTPNTGDFWFPHVYMPNQNPYDVTGANAYGRWDYGPWFWPPFTGILYGAIPNPYCAPMPPAPGSTETNPGPYDCSASPGEPPFIPGTPSNSSTPEAFGDTPVVNGVAYPVLNVPAGLVRFRILSVGNDRYFNLQLYQASSATSGIVGSIDVTNPGAGYTASPNMTITGGSGMGAIPGLATIDPAAGTITAISLKVVGSGYVTSDMLANGGNLTVNIDPPPCTINGTTCIQAIATANVWTDPTEVNMLPFNSTQNTITPFPSWWWTSGVPFSLDDRDGGVPDPRLRGPAMIQIGTEGGFLPAPAVIKNQPINFDYNRKSITVLNILQHALFLGPAERADVLVDFSNFAGKTLILYNDSTAPTPASDSRLDFYTGDPDQRDTGGAPTTLPGYGPNTRTVMQIYVDPTLPGSSATPTSTAPADDYNPATLAALQTALPLAFAASQDTIVQPQAKYDAAYPGSPATPDTVDQYVRIQDTTHALTPYGSTTSVTVPLQPKTIQELFTVDYGRMNATLGVELPNTNGTTQTTIPYGYVDPITELIQVTQAAGANAVQIDSQTGTLADGTQLWKITHNGVDTHVIHVHLFTAQLINRVGWDGAVKPPEDNELGWKDTFRMNPLEDVILAIRPIALQNVPFQVPNSIRPMDVTAPIGATNAANTPGFFQVDPAGNPMNPLITNQLVNFGWEYVWHCHILGHEENDMMRPMAIGVPPEDPTNLTAVTSGNGNKKAVTLTWTDNSLNSTGFTLQRATDSGFTANLVTVQLGKVTTYTDSIGNTNTVFFYRVRANNVVGSTAPSGFTTSVGGAYQTLTVSSGWLGPAYANLPPAPNAPTNLVATLQAGPQIALTFTDNANNETGFVLERSVNGATYALLANLPPRNNTGTVSYRDATVTLGNTYQYRVAAVITNPSPIPPSVSAYAYSGVVGVNLPTAPGPQTATNQGRQGNNNNVLLTWLASQYQTSYTVQWSTSNTFGTIVGSKTGIAASATSTTVSVPRGTPGVTTYYFRIQGVNVLGASPYAQWASGVLTQ